MDRKQKKALKQAKRKKDEASAKRLYESALLADGRKAKSYFERFGVWDVLKKSTAVDFLPELIYPEPKVVVGNSVPASAASRRLQKTLAEKLAAARFDSPALGEGFVNGG